MRVKNIIKKAILVLMMITFLIPAQSAMAAEKMSKKDFVARFDDGYETYNLFDHLDDYGEDVILFIYDKKVDKSIEGVVRTYRGIHLGEKETTVIKKYGKGTKGKLSKDIVYNRMLDNKSEDFKPYFKNVKYVLTYKYTETTDKGEVFNSRIHFYIDKDGKVAVVALSRILAKSKDDYLYYFQKGRSAYVSEKYKDAIEYYTQALKRNKEAAEVYNGLGNCYYSLEEYDDAVKNYRIAVQLDSKDADYQYNIGKALYYQSEYEEALIYLNECIELVPKYMDAYLAKGDSLYYLGRYEEALECYDKAMNLPLGDTSYVYYSKGAALYNTGKFSEALLAFDKAIEKDPEYVNAYNFKGDTLNDLGQFDAARAEYEKALKVRRDSWDAFLGIGNSYYFQEQYQKAIEYYDKAIAAEPSYLTAYSYKASSLLCLSSYDECIALCDKIILMDSTYGTGYYIKSKVYALQMKEAEFLENLKKAVGIDKIYIEYAKTEPAFDAYKNSPDFMKILSGSDK